MANDWDAKMAAESAHWTGLEKGFDEDDADLKENAGGRGNAIVNELVKSYGFSRSSDGEWDWSLGTIAQSFKDDPMWTTLDWLAIAISPLKWGTSIRAVKKGSTLLGGAVGGPAKALKAGDFARGARNLGQRAGLTKVGEGVAEWGMKGGRSLVAESGGRGPVAAIFEQFYGPEVMAAAKLYKEGPGRAAVALPKGRRLQLSNPIATKIDDDYRAILDKHGTEVYEKRAVASALKRDEIRETAFIKRSAEDNIRQLGRAGPTEQAKEMFFKSLAGGVVPSKARAFFQGNVKTAETYKNTWDFRNGIHEAAYDANLISKETRTRNLQKWAPATYKEWAKVLETTEKLAAQAPTRATRKVGVATSGVARFLGKGKEPKALTQILDPSIAIAEMGKAGAIIAKQNYAQNIAKSVIAQDADDVASAVMKYLNDGNTKMAAIHGVTRENLDTLKIWKNQLENLNSEVGAEEIAAVLGWKRLDDMFESAGKVPGYLDRLPDELRNKLIDPHVADDIVAGLKYFDNPHWINDIYKGGMTMFRVGKTAYSPPTGFRNLFGASVTHNLTVGGVPFMYPKRGLKAMSSLNEDYREGRRAGLVGSSFDAELRKDLEHMSQRGMGQASALDFLGDSKLARWMQAGGSKAERVYRGIDEVFKLDAFILLKQRGIKAGLSKEKAIEEAIFKVNKGIPQFLQHSELADTFRSAVPFSSFTTEAMRTYKNHLIDNPHRVYLWNHLFEALSQTSGAMAGFSPEQLEEAEKALPNYVQGKKTMVIPFNVDGQPRFVDLSYLIPMANIVEGEKVGHSFFSNLPIDPMSNPFASLAAAAGTGVDAFSGRKIDPNFTERQLGIPVTNQRARQVIGLGEHALRTFLPPMVPPGYTGVNLLEFARGQKNPKSGEPLEQGAWRTVMANIFGIRTYAADVESQVLNLKRTARDVNTRMQQSWRRWETARVNGKVAAMEKEKARIIGLREEGGHPDAEKYFAKSIKRREVFASLSTKQLKAALERADKLGALSPRDERLRAELIARLQKRSNR